MAAENTGSTNVMPQGRPWAPGVSGNPGGRPKGIARLAREATNGGTDLVAFFQAIFQGNVPQVGEGQAVGRDVTLKDRIEAGYWLADRGYGKAPITVNVAEDEPENPLRSFTMEELLAAHAAMKALQEPLEVEAEVVEGG